MDPFPPPLPESARATIAALIARMRDDEEARRRLWPEHPRVREWARERAAVEGRLLVPCPHWFHEVSLDADGRIVVRLDTGSDAVVERPANAREVHLTWQSYVPRTWPELAALVPPRPADAVVCEACGGDGIHMDPAGPHADVTCACGNAGWFPPEAVGMEAFLDFAPGDAAQDSGAPCGRRSWWRAFADRFARRR